MHPSPQTDAPLRLATSLARHRYAIAILLVAAGAAFRMNVLTGIESRAMFITFYPAVIVSALIGGFRAGLLASVLSTATVIYIWLDPAGSFDVTNPQDKLCIALFFFSSIAVSWIVEQMHRAHARVITAEQQASRAAERMQAAAALRDSERQHRLLSETMLQGVIYQDALGQITAANPAACRILGQTREELRGHTAESLDSLTLREDGSPFPGQEHPAMVTLRTGKSQHGVVMRVLNSREQRYRWISVSTVPLFRDGDSNPCQVYALFDDITERKQAEEALYRANQTLLIIKECNEALERAATESDLLKAICRIILKMNGVKLAWVGFAEQDEQKSVRMAHFDGDCKGYLDSPQVSWGDTPRGRGPTGTAIRTRCTQIRRGIANDPSFAPWREAMQKCGFASAISIPLLSEDHCVGALSIYSAHADAFSEEEAELLRQLAGDLAYGILSLRTRTERFRLQQELLTISEREKQLISQELHDGLCQNLAGTALLASLLHRRLADRGDEEADFAKQISTMLCSNVHETRHLAQGLHPVGPEGEALMNALSQLAATVTSFFHIDCRFDCPEPVLIENESASTHLFRITQEAINNARKHGEADCIVIALATGADGIELSVRDNGIGIPRGFEKRQGLGFRSMHYRAQEIGAALTIRRTGKKGTEVKCTLYGASASAPHASAPHAEGGALDRVALPPQPKAGAQRFGKTPARGAVHGRRITTGSAIPR